MSDQISLLGMAFYAHHGHTDEEQETGRHYEVDCRVDCSTAKAATDDDLTKTVDYAQIYAVVSSVMTTRRSRLLEQLAEEIASRVLALPNAQAVKVTVRKLHPPVPGLARAAEVTIQRTTG